MSRKLVHLVLLSLLLPLSSCGLFEELYGNPISEVTSMAIIPLDVPLPQPVTIAFPSLNFDDLPLDPETGRVRFSPVYQHIDLAAKVEQALSRVGASLKSVKLIGIKIDIEDNQLTRDADPLVIQIGSANQSQDEAPDVGQTPLFTPDMRGDHEGEVFDSAEEALTSLDFHVGLATTIDPNNPPGGVIRFNLTLRVEIRPEL